MFNEDARILVEKSSVLKRWICHKKIKHVTVVITLSTLSFLIQSKKTKGITSVLLPTYIYDDKK